MLQVEQAAKLLLQPRIRYFFMGMEIILQIQEEDFIYNTGQD